MLSNALFFKKKKKPLKISSKEGITNRKNEQLGESLSIECSRPSGIPKWGQEALSNLHQMVMFIFYIYLFCTTVPISGELPQGESPLLMLLVSYHFFFLLFPDCETSVALERRWNQIKTMVINISKCKHPALLCAFIGSELQQIPEFASLIRWKTHAPPRYTSARWEELGLTAQVATLLGASCPCNLYTLCSMGPTPICH